MKKTVSLIAIGVLLANIFVMAFDIQSVKARETIYIRADGSIYPLAAPISTADKVTYTFTGSINDSIVVERDNIVVDGIGYVLRGLGNGSGIDLSFRSNVTIKNIEIEHFDYGIYLNHSTKNIINGNIMTAINFEAVRLYESSNNNITGNNIATNVWDGIVLYGSSNNEITKNNLTSNYDGLRLYESLNTSIAENVITNNYHGIFLAFSLNNTIVKNNITANNGNGISLYWSSNENRIVENHIAANSWCGLRLNESSNNLIYHNNFVDNAYQIDTLNSVNVWDGGYPSGGNYWSNSISIDLYEGAYQNETGSDGIGDTQYTIDENNRDNYPLMGLCYNFELMLGRERYHVEVVSNSTVSNLIIGVVLDHFPPYLPFGQMFIEFRVEDTLNTTKFCRVIIPRAVLNGRYIVLIDYEEVPAHELPASNSTHAYLYFIYEHTKQKHDVIIIPEFSTAIILPFFMIMSMLAVVSSRGGFSCASEQKKRRGKPAVSHEVLGLG